MLTRTNSFPKNTNSPPPVTALTPTTGPRRNCPIFARLTARVDGVVGEGVSGGPEGGEGGLRAARREVEATKKEYQRVFREAVARAAVAS